MLLRYLCVSSCASIGYLHRRIRARFSSPCQKIADNRADSGLKGDKTMRTIHWSMGILLLALALPLAAESINPPTKPQTAPMTAQEKKNLDMVMDWWREVLYAGHFELAPKYQAENYIQHNP